MKNIIDDFSFSVGFKRNETLVLQNDNYDIVIKLKAYYEQDGITKEQEASYNDFISNRKKYIEIIESKYTNLTNYNLLIPSVLLFKRDGSFALLFDEKDNREGGIAMVLKPQFKIVDYDEFI